MHESIIKMPRMTLREIEEVEKLFGSMYPTKKKSKKMSKKRSQ